MWFESVKYSFEAVIYSTIEGYVEIIKILGAVFFTNWSSKYQSKKAFNFRVYYAVLKTSFLGLVWGTSIV